MEDVETSVPTQKPETVAVSRTELADWARRMEGFAGLLRDLSTVDGSPLHSAGEVAHSLAARMSLLVVSKQ